MKRTVVSLVITAVLGYTLAIALAVVVIAREQPTAAAPNQFCFGLPDGVLIDNPANCRAHWECIGGSPILRMCDPGFNFSPVLFLCVPQAAFFCEDPVVDDPTTVPPTTVAPTTDVVPTTTLPPDVDVPFSCPPTGISMTAVPHSCNTYRLCFMGALTVRQCASDLRFDGQLQRCNFRTLVTCNVVCPAVSDPNVVIMFESQTRCDEYFICYNGVPMPFDCATGLHWNQMTQNCDFAALVNCNL